MDRIACSGGTPLAVSEGDRLVGVIHLNDVVKPNVKAHFANLRRITRGALTTFSIANDVAKYFAIIPAIFVVSLPALGALNIMHLKSPQSAILSAVIFNALVIIALIPLALKGVKYRAIGAGALLTRNLLIYGLGGVVAPFIGIKAIDLIVSALHLA